MSSALSCCNACGTVEVTQVPGTEGSPGLDGTDGINAFSVVQVAFTIPLIGANVIVDVDSSVWMVIGQVVIAGAGYANPASGGPAHFTVISIPSATSVELQALGSIGDDVNPNAIGLYATISPSAA